MLKSNRSGFIQMLEDYKASDFEKDVVNDLLSYVKKNPNCFERNHEEGAKHIAAAVLLVNDDNQALFQWHKKLKAWTNPGGHADGDENIYAVALNELEEEVGIKDPEILPQPIEIRRYDYPKEVFGYSKSIYNLTFLAKLPKNQTPEICEPDKCAEIKWFAPEEARKIQDSKQENTEHLIDKWLMLTKK